MTWYEVIIRLILAIIVGGLIGYEREYKNRPAGFRTHILVCIGAAVTSMIQLYAIEETSKMILAQPTLANALKADIGRLGAQVITGVGFLGAGTIIHEKGSVKGLTTAASIWVVACIGLAVGLGYYFLSILSAVSVFIVLVSLKRVEARIFEKAKIIKFEIEYKNRGEMVKKLEEYFKGRNIKVQNIEFEIEEDEETEHQTCLYTILVPRHIKANDIIRDLCYYDEIIKINLV
ncbi:putative Mg2+ transporter-C (MgtC) family protein [Clostridium sp. USBA 49]|jgi:putative Mg2+ transporter-C (MgtC) family protein|uniref:MgtC/SapB family protein n=1 Tax=Clostridium TaxID=1485 RepID=UPI000999A439|nr:MULTISPECIES: MgtC/SapB family protein [Clostridium]SKA82880.1 putative Mg2+ transporter-C (MgtC) family protein [Clostridium sp. USBA 49]